MPPLHTHTSVGSTAPLCCRAKEPRLPSELSSLCLLTPDLHVRPAGWEAEQQDTPPAPGSLGGLSGFAVRRTDYPNPAPNTVARRVSRLTAPVAGTPGSLQDSRCAPWQRTESAETDLILCGGWGWGGSGSETEISSSPPRAVCRREHPGSLNCWKPFGVSPEYCPSPGIGPCLFPLDLSPVNLCVTIASGQPPV